MARIKNAVTVVEDPAVPVANIVDAQNQAAERCALVLQQFGDGLPFDLPRYEYVIRSHLSRSAEEMLAAGRALLVVREHVPHGEWREFLERINLEVRTAQRMAQAALKFSNASAPTHLIESANSKTKLIELLILDDEEIAELNDGGTAAGVTLDDIARMSSSELRRTLREARAESAADSKLLSQKNEQLDKLKKEASAAKRRLAQAAPGEVAAQIRKELSTEAFSIEAAIRTTIWDGVRKLREAGVNADTPDVHDNHCAQVIGALIQTLVDIRDELGLPAVVTDATTPPWAQDNA